MICIFLLSLDLFFVNALVAGIGYSVGADFVGSGLLMKGGGTFPLPGFFFGGFGKIYFVSGSGYGLTISGC